MAAGRGRGAIQPLLLWGLLLALLALVAAASSSSSSSSSSTPAARPPPGFLHQPTTGPKAEASAPACSHHHHHHHRHHHHQQQQQHHQRRSATAPHHAAAAAADAAEPTKTCRNCLQQYRPSENGPAACRHHTGIYSGRLARIDDKDPSGAKDWFWSCCGEEGKDGPGCVVGRHQSYDEPAGPWRSGFQ